MTDMIGISKEEFEAIRDVIDRAGKTSVHTVKETDDFVGTQFYSMHCQEMCWSYNNLDSGEVTYYKPA